ncbi:helix-turn-helix domain-containing protein [Rhodopirellula sallentina]|uniref:Transcriptional regulator n=1 Tax=Rhodopirellula sallentina SM41 TaxID=1263870 RepID=M5U1A6_9BACT|nr:hypothetical protein [Rhodopirellula sallentina]EMI55210.1 transcriptional regulator [Rhodopirellula sallentina SM41]
MTKAKTIFSGLVSSQRIDCSAIDQSPNRVRVISGANEGYYPLAGKTIANVRKGLRDVFNLSLDLTALVNGVARDDATILENGDAVEFCRDFGTKGGVHDFWSQSELIELLGPEAIDELKELGEHPVQETVYIKQQVSALIFARSSKPGIAEVPSGKLIVDFSTMTLYYGEQGPFKIDGSLKFRLIQRLSIRPGIYVHLDTLKRDVWKDEFVNDETLNRQARFARKALKQMPLPNVTLDFKNHSWALQLD